MLDFLRRYLADPYWDHAIQVLPFVAALGDRAELPFWPNGEISDAVFRHLCWSLSEWSAFRGAGTLDEKKARLHDQLPAFLRDVQTAAPAARLSAVPEARVAQLAEDWIAAFDALRVKESASHVLPSKAAHLLLPTLVPAYDQQVIAGQVLPAVLPRRAGRNFQTYVQLCWWVLDQLCREGSLDSAAALVRDHLAADWLVRSLGATRPDPTSFVARSLDSLVAEYTLIGMWKLQDEKHPDARRREPLVAPAW